MTTAALPVLCLLLALGLALVGIIGLRVWLQNRVRQQRRLEGPDVVDELTTWRIGGIDQWVQLRGVSRKNPVLLYLHGGPGMPTMPFAHAFQRDWEQSYIVVHWDQRNTGKTLTSNGVQDDVTLEQHVRDGLEVVDRIRQRFPNNPIALLGHSWGTVLAVEMIQRKPFKFAAYIGIGQVSDFLRSERYTYEVVLKEARRRRLSKSVKKLLQFNDYPQGSEPLSNAVNIVRREQLRLGFGHHSDPNIIFSLLWLGFQSPDYRWRDLLTLLNRKAQKVSLDLALRELPLFSQRAQGATLACPIIMTGGEFDLFTPTPMAREFFESLKAPRKEFIDLKGVAHFGPGEAPELFSQIVLGKLLPLLADAPSAAEPKIVMRTAGTT